MASSRFFRRQRRFNSRAECEVHHRYRDELDSPAAMHIRDLPAGRGKMRGPGPIRSHRSAARANRAGLSASGVGDVLHAPDGRCRQGAAPAVLVMSPRRPPRSARDDASPAPRLRLELRTQPGCRPPTRLLVVLTRSNGQCGSGWPPETPRRDHWRVDVFMSRRRGVQDTSRCRSEGGWSTSPRAGGTRGVPAIPACGAIRGLQSELPALPDMATGQNLHFATVGDPEVVRPADVFRIQARKPAGHRMSWQPHRRG